MVESGITGKALPSARDSCSVLDHLLSVDDEGSGLLSFCKT